MGLSQKIIRLGSKVQSAFCVTALLAAAAGLLMSCAEPSGRADGGAAANSIPAIAGIAGIQVGYTTMEELEARLGKGKPVTGGHPYGAREWRVRGTSWTIYADAFDYSARGIVVDSFELQTGVQPDSDVPFARLEKNDFVWLGLASLDLPEDKLLEVLKTRALPVTKTGGGWETSARGFSQLTSTPSSSFQAWTTSFAVTNGLVRGVSLDAR
jgi:hypothetical protein